MLIRCWQRLQSSKQAGDLLETCYRKVGSLLKHAG